MISNLFKYYWFSLKARLLLGYSVADFINQGIGIKVRSNRFKKHWSKHYNNSKNFILNCYNQHSQIKTVLVLGAGALNDLPVKELLDAGLKLFFLDLDLAAEKIWLKWKKLYPDQIEYVVCDVTGRMAEWTKLAQTYMPNELENKLFSEDFNLEKLLDRKFDLVISLNILSQLGVIWKERLFLARSKEVQERLHDLSTKTTGFIEREHLDLISKISERGFILISDKYFHYYKPDQTDWQTEFATSIDYEEYLSSDDTIVFKDQNRWLWHIKPANTEGLDYGEIHQVRAYFMAKKSCEHTTQSGQK